MKNRTGGQVSSSHKFGLLFYADSFSFFAFFLFICPQQNNAQGDDTHQNILYAARIGTSSKRWN